LDLLQKKFKKIFLVIVLCILITGSYSQDGNIKIAEIVNKDKFLTVSVSFDSLFDEKIVQGLDRGLTVQIEYNIELWQSKTNWFDSFIDSKNIWFKVLYNRWQKKYVLVTEIEKRSTDSFQRIEKLCTNINNIPLSEINSLEKNAEYYIIAKCILKPLTIENIEEMSNWLRGKRKNDEKKIHERGVTDKLIELVVNLTGFGDKYYSCKSGKFKIGEDNSVIVNQ